jgi:hypothetical protein
MRSTEQLTQWDSSHKNQLHHTQLFPFYRWKMKSFGAYQISALCLFLLGCDVRSPAPQSSEVKLTEQQKEFITKWERNGYLVVEPEKYRAYVAPVMWQNIDAKEKEKLVNMLTVACAERRSDSILSMDIIDKVSGRKLASFDSSKGVEIY